VARASLGVVAQVVFQASAWSMSVLIVGMGATSFSAERTRWFARLDLVWVELAFEAALEAVTKAVDHGPPSARRA
jgi:hypothetical protein